MAVTELEAMAMAMRTGKTDGPKWDALEVSVEGDRTNDFFHREL